MSTEKHASSNHPEDQLPAIRRESNIRSYGLIKELMGSGMVDSLPLRVRCECSIPTCEEIIEVSLAKRRELRRKYPRGFIVALSHAGSFEDVILCTTEGEFSVVEKLQFTEAVADLQ